MLARFIGLPLNSIFVEAMDVSKRAKGRLTDIDVLEVGWDVVWFAFAQSNYASKLALKQAIAIQVTTSVLF